MTVQTSDTKKDSPGKSERVVIFGNASMAGACYMELTYDSRYEVAGFTVDRDYLKEEKLFGLPVVPFDEVGTAFPPETYHMMVAVGYVQVNRLRADRFRDARNMGYQLISSVSSRATTWPDLLLGENCRIGSHTAIQPFAKIGDNVFIGDGVVLGHHAVIEDHCFIASGVTIAGGVTVGQSSFLGTGAVVRNQIKIGKDSVVGAGAVILEDTRERSVFIAATAEELKITSDKLSL